MAIQSPVFAPRKSFSAPSFSALYQRLLTYVRPYRWVFGMAFLGMLITAAGDVILLQLIKPLIDNFVQTDPRLAYWLPVWLVTVFFLRGLGSYLGDYGMAWVGHRVVADLRMKLVAHLHGLPVPFFDHHATGGLITRVTHDASGVASAVSSALTTALRNSLTLVVLLFFLFHQNWQLTLIGFAVIPPVLLIARYFNRRLRHTARGVQAATGQLTHLLEEDITGQRIVKVFSGANYEAARLNEATENLRHISGKQSSATALSGPVIQLLASIVVGLIIWFALRQTQAGVFTVGGFTAYVFGMLRVLDQIKGMAGINATIQRGLAAAESIFWLLDQTPEENSGTVSAQEIPRAQGNLRFTDVSLNYQDQLGSAAPTGAELTPRYALNNFSLAVAAGETVAIVGPSGSGKSSLVNLIPRFYEPSSGTIALDGRSLADWELAHLRAQIAWVGQDTLLFNDTVAANIAYGLPSARMEDIQRAAVQAHAHEFILALSQGYQTSVGERGVQLSGGQRQRIAIARAILKNAPILILDEATSALDSASEREVQAALEVLMQGRTTLVIAHRLSTVERADRIVVLDQGSIVEMGSHQELLQRGELYSRLYHLQFGTQAKQPTPSASS